MKRIAYIDFLKAFAIATVLLGHSVEQLSGDAFWDHPIWSFLYSFHMPLFMFVSGRFFKSALRKDFRTVLGGKLVQLGLPSVSAFLVGLAILKVMGVTAIADLCEASFAVFVRPLEPWFVGVSAGNRICGCTCFLSGGARRPSAHCRRKVRRLLPDGRQRDAGRLCRSDVPPGDSRPFAVHPSPGLAVVPRCARSGDRRTFCLSGRRLPFPPLEGDETSFSRRTVK